MMRYPYDCSSCEFGWFIEAKMSDERPDNPECPSCGGVDTFRVWQGQTPIGLVKGNRKGETLYNAAKPGRNQAEGYRTPAQQEQHMKKVVAENRGRAEETARIRSGSRREDGEMRHVGSIPAELFRCVQRTTGNQHVWRDEGRPLLKRHGLLFKD